MLFFTILSKMYGIVLEFQEQEQTYNKNDDSIGFCVECEDIPFYEMIIL